MKLKRIKQFMLLYLIILFAQTLIVFYYPTIGLADNSDYNRSISPFGMHAVDGDRYLNFESEFYIDNPLSTKDYLIAIFQGNKRDKLDYTSTQFIFTKMSLVVNSFHNNIKNIDVHKFDIRFLGMIYISIYSLAVTIFVFFFQTKNKYFNYIIKIIATIILMDSGYMVYMNSFFGETTTLIFFVMSIAIISKNISGKVNFIDIILLLISIIIFSGSKMANFPSALLLISIVVLLSFKLENKLKKSASIILIIFSLINIFTIYNSTPDWMEKVTTYQSVFYGILKDNDNPKVALNELNLPMELEVLANTHGYMANPEYNIYGPEFEELFFDKVSKITVLKYYIKHPLFLIKKLDKSAEASISLKPTYLGNFRYEDIQERLSFTNRFNLWETFRKRFSGIVFITLGLIFTLYILLIIYITLRLRTINIPIFIDIILILNAFGQFLVPIIGNGEADLMKHMFLFNISFDIMFLFLIKGIFDIMANIHIRNLKRLLPLSIVSILVVTTMLNFSNKPDLNQGAYVNFGSYNDINITWRILHNENDTLTLIADNIILEKSFSLIKTDLPFGSSRWKDSELKIWLNGPFLDSFKDIERLHLVTQNYKTLLSYNHIDKNVDGVNPHYWYSMPAYALSNYNEAYYEINSDYVSLPSVKDIQYYFDNISKNIAKQNSYWTNTPYYSSESMVRIIARDGLIYHKDAIVSDIGVVPMIKIEIKNQTFKGNGKKNTPYTLKF